MKPTRYVANMLISLKNFDKNTLDAFAADVIEIIGVEEFSLHTEDDVAYLKVDNHILQTESLQQLIANYDNAAFVNHRTVNN
jgi:hypothetical protein